MDQYRIGFLFLISTVLLIGCGPEERVDLSLRWPEGDSFRYVQTVDQNISRTVDGETRTQNQKQVFTYRQDVLASTEDTTVIKSSIERIRQNLSNGRSLSFDSDNSSGSNHPATEALSAIVGHSFRITLNPDGAIKSVDGINEMYDKILSKLYFRNPRRRQMLKQSLRQLFGEETIEQSFGKAFKVYGQEPRTLNESWHHTSRLTKPVPMVVKTNYTLTRLKDNRAVIAVDATISPNDDANPVTTGNRKVSYYLDGTQSGTTVIDTRNQMLKKTKLHQSISGRVKPVGRFGEEGSGKRIDIESVYQLKGQRITKGDR